MRYVAFLRAINVGGRVVKMDDLRRHFTSAGFSGVQTFIASGNVIFRSSARSTSHLERSIESALEEALGYPVAAFVRSLPELTGLVAHPLVSGDGPPGRGSTYVAFLRAAPAKDAARKLMAFSNGVDEFHVHGREVIWVIRRAFGESTFSGAALEKTLAMPATVRNSTTVRKIADKYVRE